MRLDQALVERKLCESRTEAQELIRSGYVLVDGAITTKQTKEIHDGEIIKITQGRRFVSRGGDKLEGAFLHIYRTKEHVYKKLHNKLALDVGSSTGGFTDCLLQYGVQHVVAVDVGSNQFHQTLRSNNKISLYEKTDIRKYTSNFLFDVIVADLSFIPLEKVLDTLISFGQPTSEYFLLIKPQFEVGAGNTKKGIVKNTVLVEQILEKYKSLLESKGFTHVTVFPSRVVGGDGNQEYFLHTIK